MDADPVVLRRAPLPRQVADYIRNAIDHGDYQPGATLPPERLLVEKFQVSLTVIRQALMLLVAEGRVIKVNGKGTVVRGRPPVNETIQRTADNPWTELTPFGDPVQHHATANRYDARVLDVMEGSAVFVLDQNATHTRTGNRVLTRRMISNRIFERMPEHDHPDPFGPRDQIIKALIKYHSPLTTVERVRPAMPDPDERESLGLAPGDLMLTTVRITRGTGILGLMAETERYGEGIELEYALG
jgi:DNA-binding GntR family transcriptional regulator